MKKVPARKKLKDGGSPTEPPVLDLSKGDKLPAGAAFVPNVPGMAREAHIYIKPDGTQAFYYLPEGVSQAATDLPLSPPPATTGTPITPAVAKTATPLPVKTPEQTKAEYTKALADWRSSTAGKASAQKVPTNIANYIQGTLRPSIQTSQKELDKALAAKYGADYDPTTGPKIGQALSRKEGEKILGKENYSKFLGDVAAYKDYRDTTLGTYSTRAETAGATDPTREMYGTRMSELFKNTPEQSAYNTALTPPNVLEWQKNPDMKAFSKSAAADILKQAQDVPQVRMLGPNNENIPVMKYDINGKPIIEKPETTPYQFKKGGLIPKKRKGYAEGSLITPDLSSLNAEQLAQYNSIADPTAQQEFLASLTGAGAPMKSPMAIPYGAIGNLAGNAVDQYVEVDPDKNKQEIGKAMASGALKGAGTGAAIGSAIPVIGTGIGAGVGALVGATAGFMKGKRKAKAYDEEMMADSIASAQDATHNLAEGGPIEGAGTAKSDSIKAEIKAGSFVVPAENAKAAERLRKLYLAPTGDAKLNQGGGVPVKLSDGEHLFSPEEVAMLKKRGVNLDALAPNQEDYYHGLREGGMVSVEKAKEILRDGTANGKKLTDRQKGYFGWIAGGSKKDGGEIEGYKDGGGVKGMSDADLKKKREELQKEYDDLSGPGANLVERSLMQVGKEKELKEIDAEIQNRELEKKTTEFKPKPIEAPKQGSAQQLLEEGFKNPQTGKEVQSVPQPGKATAKPKPAGTGTRTASQEKPSSAEQAAIQAAFLKEHGGIASQQAPVTETGKTATSVDTITNLKAEYEKAETLEDVTRIRQQMRDLGYNSDGTPIMGSAKANAASVLSQLNTPASQAQAAADETFAAETGQAPPPPPSGIQKVFQSLGGAAGLAAIGQIGLGAYFSAKDKAPVDKVDPQLLAAQQRAQQQATYGFEPELLAQQKARIESNRRGVVSSISQFAGGNVGTAIGNTRMATIDANQANLGLAAASQQAQQQKQGYADNLTSQVAAANRQIFQDAQQKFMINQQVGSNLIGAGLSNLFGSMQYQNQQQRIDDRMAKYGSDPWTNYAPQQPTI